MANRHCEPYCRDGVSAPVRRATASAPVNPIGSGTIVDVKRLLVVLDLDETLIHGSTSIAREVADFDSGPYRCLIRPHALDLIDSLLDQFEVAVWTSAGELHAQSVVDALFDSRDDIAFLWTASRCTDHRDFENDRTVSLKNLKKLRRYGYELDRVIAIDDSPEKHMRNYGNLIRVEPWFGESDDNQLAFLADYVSWVSTHDDVRRVEKRGWSKQTHWRNNH
jgi:carboxy-terminal domain RNA polymerase II polypeptide A small phosphatase